MISVVIIVTLITTILFPMVQMNSLTTLLLVNCFHHHHHHHFHLVLPLLTCAFSAIVIALPSAQPVLTLQITPHAFLSSHHNAMETHLMTIINVFLSIIPNLIVCICPKPMMMTKIGFHITLFCEIPNKMLCSFHTITTLHITPPLICHNYQKKMNIQVMRVTRPCLNHFLAQHHNSHHQQSILQHLPLGHHFTLYRITFRFHLRDH